MWTLKQPSKQPVLSLRFSLSPFYSLYLMLFSNDHRENVTATVIAHDKVTCAPHRMGYTGVEGVGGPMSRVQPYGLCNPPPCLPRHQCWPAREREAVTAACPLMLGPLLDSGEGKETRQGEARSNTHQKSCLCLCWIWQRMRILKHAERQLDRQQTCGWGGCKCTQPISQSYISSIKCCLSFRKYFC